MRILMTADTVGGVWTYAMELCRSLADHGIEVLLATMGSVPSEWQRAEAQSCGNVTLAESEYRLEWMADPWDDVRDAGRWLLQLRDRFRPDLVHLNGYCHGRLDWDLPVLMVAHSCVLGWWLAVKRESAPDAWRPYREMVSDGVQAATMVVAPSQAMLDSVQVHYGPIRSGRVIYNGRDGSFFRPSAKDRYILSAGRVWDEAKNVRLLCEIADRVIWPLNVAGSQEHPDGRDIRDVLNVRLLGMLDPGQMQAMYSRAAVYAAPALYEPFGLSILEAALSGCALVLGDIPSLREIWGDAALYADPHDGERWIEQLNAVCSEHDLRRQLAHAARERASRYTPYRMAEGYVQTYRELLAGTAPVATSRDWSHLTA